MTFHMPALLVIPFMPSSPSLQRYHMEDSNDSRCLREDAVDGDYVYAADSCGETGSEAVFVGLEIGGTNLKVGVVSREGELLGEHASEALPKAKAAREPQVCWSYLVRVLFKNWLCCQYAYSVLERPFVCSTTAL